MIFNTSFKLQKKGYVNPKRCRIWNLWF